MAKAHRNTESCFDNPPPRSDRLKLRLAFDQGNATATLENEPLIGDPVPVRVGPSDFTVHLHRGYIPFKGEPCLGICDTGRRRIYVSDEEPPAGRVATFFHELAHAIFSACDFAGLDSYDSEQTASLLEIGLGTLDPATLSRVYKLLGAV